VLRPLLDVPAVASWWNSLRQRFTSNTTPPRHVSQYVSSLASARASARGQSAAIKDGLTGVHSDVAAEVIAAVYENYGATLPEKTEEQSVPPPAMPSGRKRRSGASTSKTSETQAG